MPSSIPRPLPGHIASHRVSRVAGPRRVDHVVQVEKVGGETPLGAGGMVVDDEVVVGRVVD